MSFRTNTNVMQGIATNAVVNALGSTTQTYSPLLDNIAAVVTTGNPNRPLVVNSGGTGLVLAAQALGSAAFATTGTAAGNVPVIGANGKLGAAILPAVSVSTVATVAARDALTPAAGDIAVVSGVGKTYSYSGSAWVELVTMGIWDNTNDKRRYLNLFHDGFSGSSANQFTVNGGSSEVTSWAPVAPWFIGAKGTNAQVTSDSTTLYYGRGSVALNVPATAGAYATFGIGTEFQGGLYSNTFGGGFQSIQARIQGGVRFTIPTNATMKHRFGLMSSRGVTAGGSVGCGYFEYAPGDTNIMFAYTASTGNAAVTRVSTGVALAQNATFTGHLEMRVNADGSIDLYVNGSKTNTIAAGLVPSTGWGIFAETYQVGAAGSGFNFLIDYMNFDMFFPNGR